MGVGDWIRSWAVYRQPTGADRLVRGAAAASRTRELTVRATDECTGSALSGQVWSGR